VLSDTRANLHQRDDATTWRRSTSTSLASKCAASRDRRGGTIWRFDEYDDFENPKRNTCNEEIDSADEVLDGLTKIMPAFDTLDLDIDKAIE
jgi:hypothetical protein